MNLATEKRTMWPSPNPILHITIFMKYAFQLKFHYYSMIYFVLSLMRLLLCFIISPKKLFVLVRCS